MNKQPIPTNRSAAEVSVVIISYNHGAFLRAAIESVLCQTFKNFELLIIDDASQDESFEIAKEYEEKHPEMVRALKHPGEINKGIAATLNLGIANASCKYLMFLASDDLLPSDSLETLAEALKKNSDVEFAYGTADVIDAEGKKTADWITVFDSKYPEEQAILGSGWIPAGQMITRDCAVAIGGFDENITYGDDWDFWIRVLIRGKGFFVNKSVYQYRRHKNNITNGFHALNELDILTKLRHKVFSADLASSSSRLSAVINLQRAYVLFLLNNYEQARELIAEAFLEAPALKQDKEFLDQWLVKPYRSWEFKNHIFGEHLSLKKMTANRTFSKKWTADFCARAAAFYNSQDNHSQASRKAFQSIFLDPGKITDIRLLKILTKQFLPKSWIKAVRKINLRNNAAKAAGAIPEINQPAVYYLAPDTDTPSWGVGIIYEHVKILCESGYPAAVLHFNAPFRISWRDAAVPVYYLNHCKHSLRADDVLIIPEVLAHLKELDDIPCRKVIHVQNAFLIESQNQENIKYQKAESCLTIMPHCKNILEKFYEMSAHIVPPFVAPYFFFPYKNWDIARTKTILFYPKSASQDSSIVINYLRRWIKQGHLDWNVVEIKNRQHCEVADLMKQSVFFVNTNCREAFNTSVPEAMAAGCICLCYEAFGGKDFLKDNENAYVFSNNDAYGLIEKLKELIRDYENKKREMDAMRKRAFDTASAYQRDKTRVALVDFFNQIMIKKDKTANIH